MQKQMTQQPVIHLIGLTARTNSRNEFQPATAKIGPLLNEYASKNLAAQIPHRLNPGVMIAAYTEYESDEHGDYTYFVGEAVSSLAEVPANFQVLTIPAGQYLKLTTSAGPMPMAVINAWQQIWQMNKKDFGGERVYHTDYEVYDQRAADPMQVVVDIYLGIK